MQSTSLREELLAVARALQETQHHIRCVRAHAPSSRLASRLEADVHRILVDLEDLAAQTAVPEVARTDEAPGVASSSCSVCLTCYDRTGCDDEGVAGGWQGHRTVTSRRSRHRRHARV